MACKDMVSGEQTKLDFQGTLERVQAELNRRSQGSVIQ